MGTVIAQRNKMVFFSLLAAGLTMYCWLTGSLAAAGAEDSSPPAAVHVLTASMCVDPDWEPFEKLSPDGAFSGIAADLIRLIAERANVRLEIFPTQSWDESLLLSQKGKCILLPFLNRTRERDQWLDFTRPYFRDPNVFVTRMEHDYIANVAGLRNKIMVLPSGTSMEERVRMDYPNLDLVIVPDEVTVFRMVEDGRADMTLRSLTMAAYTIRKEGWFNLKIAGEIPDYANELRAAVHKDYPELRERLDAAIATLTPGEIQDAVNRHVSITVGYRMDYGLLFQVAGTLVVLLVAVFLWTVQLRRFNRKLAAMADKATRAEQHLRQLIDLMPGYVFVRDQQGRFVITNRALADLLGCPPDRVAGKTDLDYGADPDHVFSYLETDRRVMETGLPCVITEERGIRRDGSPGWFQTRKVLYGETETGIRSVLGVAFDISDQKRMNDRLMESERSKSVLLKNLKGMAYRCRYDEYWTMVFVSDGCYDLTGYQPEELIENAKISYNKIIAPEYREMARRKWSEGVKTRESVELEYEIMPASGGRKWVWEQGRVIFGSGTDVEAIEGLILDISDRKRMEIHLQESQHRYDQLAAKSRTYSWEVDGEGRYTFVSSTVEAVLGYRPDEMVGHMYFYDICLPEDREEQKQMGLQIIAEGRDLLDGEDRVLSRDQRILWVLCSGVAIRNEEGRVTGFRGTATDITERRKMAERIQHLALHDSLTGLPNRTLFEDRVGMALAAARRDHGSLCLMFMDLDLFKPVNDRFGHRAGDILLQAVASRITGVLRGSDTAARIGGDEFVILLPRIRQPQDGMRVAEKLREALTEPFEIDGHVLTLSASIGVAIYPGAGGTYKDLCGRADVAMYQAKKEGGNRVVVCAGC